MLTAGIDLIEIERIQESIRNPRFCERVYGGEELVRLKKRGFPAQSAAAAFCAKEAFAKAMGTGVRGFALHEVELLHDRLGKPFLHFSGDALALVTKKQMKFTVSVTHTKAYASAVVIGQVEKDEGIGCTADEDA